MNYQIHDVSCFPLIALNSEVCTPGFSEAWCQEMDQLVCANDPFVIAFDPSTIEETPEDYRVRAMWFKANRQILQGRCAAMAVIVPSSSQRKAMKADLGKRTRGFGVPYLAVASWTEIQEQTPELVEACNVS